MQNPARSDGKSTSTVQFIPVVIDREIAAGDDLADLLLADLQEPLAPGDVVIVTHKAVAKAEGRLIKLSDVVPSSLAEEYAKESGKDPRFVELILRESSAIVRMNQYSIIVKTKQGPTCANAGIDFSNLGTVDNPESCSKDPTACLLPKDPDLSAQRLYNSLQARCGFAVPVIVSDSFGRPWREGIVNFAIGSCGLDPFTDYRGQTDSAGRTLKVTRMASADALAAGAELACGKLKRAPFVIVRGFEWQPSTLTARALIRPDDRNLFP
ncbi:MAG: coenzyme F420-0:L-glutamate ligase [bacterium]|nr:coenzyme F420-0:L-glutamate ligase [bacterium]